MQKKQRTQSARSRVRVAVVGRNYKKQIAIITSIFIVVAVTVSGIIWNNNRGRVLGVEETVAITIPLFYTEPLVATRGDQALTVTPKKGTRVPVEQDGNVFTYRDAYKNTDVIQTDLRFKIKEELVFHAPGHPTEFSYELGNIDQYIVEEDERGNIIFHDKNLVEEQGDMSVLTRVFTIPTPFVEDATRNRSFVDLETVIEGDTMTVSIDKEWLKTAMYPVILDPTIEIQVLNVFSHPQLGDDWKVSFTTQGMADLYIHPDNQDTIDDDDFRSLKCNGFYRQPEILPGDVIFYPDWECDGVGEVVHFTKRAGHHTLRFEFGDQVAYAFNAATKGDYLIRRNDAETDSVTTSNLDATWDTEVASSGTSVTYSAGTFTMAAGKYLVMWSERYDTLDTTNNRRVEIQGRLVVGGNATTTGAGQTYIRKEDGSAGDWQRAAIVHGAGILDIPSDSTSLVTRFYRTDSSSDAGGTIDRTPDWGGISILALDPDWNYARYELSSETATVDTFSDVVWDNTSEEDTGFTRTGANIAINTAGRYLVSYTIPITKASGNDRTEFVTRLTLDDTEVGGSRVSTYLRGNESTDDGVISYVGIIDVPAGGGSDNLAVEMDSTDGTITGDNMEAGSSIQIVQLPATAEVIIAEATSGAMNPSTLTEFAWDTTAHIDTDTFTMGAGTDSYFDVDTSDDFLFFATQATDNGGTRTFPSARFSVNDVIVNYAAGGQYNRSSTADDAGYAFGALVTGLTAGDDISLENLYIEVDHLDQTLNFGAISAVSLDSLYPSTPNMTWATGAADFEIWESGSLTWDAGTQICSGTLTDDNAATITCNSGKISPSTQYRIQMELDNAGDGAANMNGAGDYVDHVNVKAGWAGTNPTLGTCGFNDNDADDGSTTCTVAFNSNDVRITNTGGGDVVLAATTGAQGFMYLITTDTDAAQSSTSYMNTSIDSDTEDSSKITINAINTTVSTHTSSGAVGSVAAGQDIYWSATWSDPDSGEMIRVVVCKTDAISSGSCTGGTWCASPTFTNRNPEGLCKYTTQLADANVTPYNYYLFVCDDDNECTNSTTSTFTISDEAPSAPSSPLVENMPNPVNIATTTPRFSSIYEDDNTGDTANKYCVEVNDQPDFLGTDMWTSDSDSCNTGVALTSCIQSNRCQDIYYDGTALTLNNTTYYWRMWYWDDEGTISDTSTAATFTTANGSGSSPRGVRMTGFDLKGGVRLK